MKKIMNNIKLVSSGSYAPAKILSNADLEKIVETSDEWITTRTGIKNRHIAEGEDTSDLAYKAAINVLEKANYDKNKLDLIIVATVTPDLRSPAVSNLVQAKLGLSDKDITCFDVNAACSGYIYALNVASQMLNSGKYTNALVIGAEKLSKYTDYTDRNTCVLFGDGAGCVILEATEEKKPAYFYAASQGELDRLLYIDDFVHMDGKKVYQFAIGAVEKAIKRVLTDSGLSLSDISYIVPHQANIRIIQSVAKTMEIPMDKFYINIHNYGNTSAASIALALDEFLSTGSTKAGDKLLLVGFGGGFTYGAAVMTL